MENVSGNQLPQGQTSLKIRKVLQEMALSQEFSQNMWGRKQTLKFAGRP